MGIYIIIFCPSLSIGLFLFFSFFLGNATTPKMKMVLIFTLTIDEPALFVVTHRLLTPEFPFPCNPIPHLDA